MDDYQVIIRPIITERSTHLAMKRSAYTFEVHPLATKPEIKKAIEGLYNVKVDKVRTSNYSGKVRRRGRIFGQTKRWKKAVVFLKPDYHIDLL
ncbi:MAG: 50S ribosomal protein L23 [Sedimentisphaerales bacterium]|nr:50S ribosomal protein L23 [Sedimentisphaerales bacterium]